MAADVVVGGQLARDLVLVVDEMPEAGDSRPVRQRREMLGGKDANVLLTERPQAQRAGVRHADTLPPASRCTPSSDLMPGPHSLRRRRSFV